MKADILIKNGIIVTMDKNDSVYENGFVGIKEDRIIYVGREKIDAERIIDAKGGIVLPGLINSHTHIPMSLFRGIAEDIPLKEWLEKVIFPIEKRLSAELVYTGSLLSCAEMIMTGTTTFCDMYIFEDEVAKAAKKTGMRCIISEALYDFPSPNYGSVENGFRYTEWLIEKWKDDPLVNPAVGPHTLYTCSEDVLKRANEISLKYSVPLIIHVSETEEEVKKIRERYGKKPFEFMESLGMLRENTIAAHCIHVDEEEIRLISKYNVKVVHCPECNMKLASGIAPVSEMLKEGICVCLGTDGCASNNNLDLLCEMDTCAKLHKIRKMDPTEMPAKEVLKMATIYGAKALGLDHVIGSIEVGKKADIIIVDSNRPHLLPMYDPYSNLVYSAIGDDVIFSIINGKIVMEERRLLTVDLSHILREVKKWEARIKEWIS